MREYYRRTIMQVIIPLIVSLIGVSWYTQEKQRRKIERYEKLIECLDSFYSYDRGKEPKGSSKEQTHSFITHYRISFMYFPDKVVERINIFFDMVSSGRNNSVSGEEKQEALSSLMIEIRKDILNSWIYKFIFNFLGKEIDFLRTTRLSPNDFRHVAIDLE